MILNYSVTVEWVVISKWGRFFCQDDQAPKMEALAAWQSPHVSVTLS
jgi:hypothetical protein